jgi:demethylmenaquinone methyltransferase/2-methoxy-6-polyprenyl-1,4-benzoquinol methylase
MSDQAPKPGTTHFGFREVPTADKQKLVGEVFSSVAGKYDLMNDLMSLGIHRVWKRYFVADRAGEAGRSRARPGGGTGDIAALLRERVGDCGEIVLGDINAGMLGVGRDRMTDRGKCAASSTCSAMPRSSRSPMQLRPGHDRVRPAQRHRQGCGAARDATGIEIGGQARVLEFSEVQAQWFKPVYDFHSFNILPKLGKLFAQDADSYQYLAESIRQHPPQDALKAMMESAGFVRCDYKNLNAGIVAIHTGYKV